MLTISVLIAIIVLGGFALLVLMAIFLKSKSNRAGDSKTMLAHINSSLDDIMERVDSLEAQRKAGTAAVPNRTNPSEVDDFLSQFGARESGRGDIAGEVFRVQDSREPDVGNEELWAELSRHGKKLDGHDRETQASLKPRTDRPMMLSRQTLVPQGGEQEKMQEQIRRQEMRTAFPQSGGAFSQRHTVMPQAAAPSQRPVSQQGFVQPVFASAGQDSHRQPEPKVVLRQEERPVAQSALQQGSTQSVQSQRQPVAPQQPNPPKPQPPRPSQQTPVQPTVVRQAPAQQTPVQPTVVRQAPVQQAPVQQTPMQPVFRQPQVQPVRQAVAPQPQPMPQTVAPHPREDQRPDGNMKFSDRNSDTDKQGRSYSVEELMQQIR